MPTLAEAQGSPADAAGAREAFGTVTPPASGVAKPVPAAQPAVAKPPQPAPAAAPDPAAKPEPPKGDDKSLNRIATLSREAREARAKAEAAEKRAAELEADAKVFRELKAGKDPKRVAKELGLTFEEFVDAYAVPSEAAPDPMKEIEKVKATIEAKAKADEDARKKAEADAVAAQVKAAEAEAASNILQQIKAAPERWEILSRLDDAGAQAVEAFKLLRAKAQADGGDIPSDQVGPILLEVLDALEAECDKIGQRYRKTGKPQGEQVASEPTGQRGTLADRQSERVPPKTIDPSISEGGILQRAQQAIADNSSEAVRARIKARLRDSGVRILQR